MTNRKTLLRYPSALGAGRKSLSKSSTLLSIARGWLFPGKMSSGNGSSSASEGPADIIPRATDSPPRPSSHILVPSAPPPRFPPRASSTLLLELLLLPRPNMAPRVLSPVKGPRGALGGKGGLDRPNIVRDTSWEERGGGGTTSRTGGNDHNDRRKRPSRPTETTITIDGNDRHDRWKRQSRSTGTTNHD